MRDQDDKPRSDEDREPEPAPEDQPGEVGAEGGSKTARRSKLPPWPDKEDESPLGDTDQHSAG